jgi:ribosomal protein L11 methyltransferase
MPWLSISIETDCHHAEALADALLEAGALSASIEDADAGTRRAPQFGEPGSVTTPGWERSRVVALLPTPIAIRTNLLAAMRRAAAPASTTFRLYAGEIAEQNWVQLTQSQFDPIRVSERCGSSPPGTKRPTRTPSCSSSTRAWPSAPARTRPPGCAWNGWSARSSPASRCSTTAAAPAFSAIAAAKLGAGEVLGVDIDPQAVSAAKSNAERNEVSARFDDSAKEIKGQFDIVVANILSNPLKALAPAICAHVRPGGSLALSGILAEQADDLIACYAPYLSARRRRYPRRLGLPVVA